MEADFEHLYAYCICFPDNRKIIVWDLQSFTRKGEKEGLYKIVPIKAVPYWEGYGEAPKSSKPKIDVREFIDGLK